MRYQSNLRGLKVATSPYRLPEGKTITTAKAISLEAAIATYENLKSAERSSDSKKENMDDQLDLEVSLNGLLNYIDTGAALVVSGDMDKSRFINCFGLFATEYFERYDHSYVGLMDALKSSKNPDGTLQIAADQFPYTACVIEKKCDKKKMADH